MGNLDKIVMAIFGGIITLAIISVFVGQKSQAPQAIQAASSGLAKVVAAAVNPVSTASTNGNPALGSFSTPAL